MKLKNATEKVFVAGRGVIVGERGFRPSFFTSARQLLLALLSRESWWIGGDSNPGPMP